MNREKIEENTEYTALVRREKDQASAVVPDLNHTSSFGDGTEEALKNATEACELYCAGLDALPTPSTLEELTDNGEFREGDAAYTITINAKKVRTQKTLENIELYQNCGMFHPLTCGTDSRHPVLKGREEDGKVILACEECGYTQENFSIPTTKQLSEWLENSPLHKMIAENLKAKKGKGE